MNQIKEIKIGFKKLLATSLEKVIGELISNLNTEISLFDEAIIQQSRYNQVKKDFDLNVLTKENRDLVLDKIRISVLACINSIKINDLKESTSDKILDSESHILIQKEELRTQMKEVLNEVGIDLKSIFQKGSVSIKEEIKGEISNLLNQMEKKESKNETNEDGHWHITIGEAHYAKEEWDKSAYHFEKASYLFPYNWQLHFAKSVAYANSRKNEITHLKALKSYGETIVYMPKDIDMDLKGRIFTYRGAMFKRLNRLDEAESDLKLGEKLVNSEYEKQDVYYNLACIYAMKKDKEKMLIYIRKLSQKFGYKSLVLFHLNHYFKNFKEDKDLIQLMW